MSLSKHIEEHVKLGLDFRFPTEGDSYIKFTPTKVEIWVGGNLKRRWNA